MPVEFVEKVFSVENTNYFCSTCQKKALAGEIPKACLSNGLAFPVIPDVLKVSELTTKLINCQLGMQAMQIQGLNDIETFFFIGFITTGRKISFRTFTIHAS